LKLLERHDVDVLLLDDGFQHWPLARDLDIVLIDTLDPFAGGGVFPRGRLREGYSALRRADAIVLNRAEEGRKYTGLQERIRQYNAAAPMFLARVEAKKWVEVQGDGSWQVNQLHGGTFAFCGLGNPDSFWRTLRELEIGTVGRRRFPDHHRYQITEMQLLAEEAVKAGADWLLTTGKDAINLPEGVGPLIAPVRVAALQMRIAIDEEDRFAEMVSAKLGLAARRHS
jgi:tetraacyldisaccharide 4'-kinase